MVVKPVFLTLIQPRIPSLDYTVLLCSLGAGGGVLLLNLTRTEVETTGLGEQD